MREDLQHFGPQAEAIERAQDAVAAFRKMVPGLSSYARAITGNPKTRVQMTPLGPPRTDGATILIPPPIGLGTRLKHDDSLCDTRTDDGLKACEKCRVIEEINVNVYHEIAHIAFGTFKDGNNYGTKLREVNDILPLLFNSMEDARVDASMFEARNGIRKMMQADVMRMFRLRHEGNATLPLDVQVTLAFYLEACGYKTWEDYFDQRVLRDIKGDSQLRQAIGQVREAKEANRIYVLARRVYKRLVELGYYEHPEPEEPETDEQDDQTDNDATDGSEPEGEDQQDGDTGEQGPGDSGAEDEQYESGAEQQESGEDSSGGSGDEDHSRSGAKLDSSEVPDADDGGSDEGSTDDGQDDGGEAGVPDESDGSPEAPPEGDVDDGRGDNDSGTGGDSGEGSPDHDEAESDSDQAGVDSGGSVGEDESDDEEGHSGPGGKNSGDGVEPDDHSEQEAQLERDDAEGGSEPGGDESQEGGEGSTEGDSSNDPGGSGEGSSGDSTGAGGGVASGEGSREDEREQGQAGGSTQAGLQSEEADSGEAGDSDSVGADGTEQPDGDEPGEEGVPGDSSMAPEPDTGERDVDGDGSVKGQQVPDQALEGDAGSPRAEGGSLDIQEGEEDQGPLETDITGSREADVNYGTVEDIQDAMEGMHSSSEQAEQSGLEDTAVAAAVVQGEYFETPSYGVLGVHEHKRETGPSFASRAEYAARRRAGASVNLDIPESLLGKALMVTRRVFSDNKRSDYTPNMRSGRVNARVLGRRAWSGDDRLFGKKRVPGKRDYAVMIMLDISTSNAGSTFALLKRSVMAQAEMCHRVGIDFAVVAHSATGHRNGDDIYFEMHLHHVKGFSEPWTNESRAAMQALMPHGGNLDGHAMEYARKTVAKTGATDQVIMYYTDGNFPAANADEEADVLARQLKLIKRENVTLLAVGMRTNSPEDHGLDTVVMHGDDDMISVVNHLGKRLLKPAR